MSDGTDIQASCARRDTANMIASVCVRRKTKNALLMGSGSPRKSASTQPSHHEPSVKSSTCWCGALPPRRTRRRSLPSARNSAHGNENLTVQFQRFELARQPLARRTSHDVLAIGRCCLSLEPLSCSTAERLPWCAKHTYNLRSHVCVCVLQPSPQVGCSASHEKHELRKEYVQLTQLTTVKIKGPWSLRKIQV